MFIILTISTVHNTYVFVKAVGCSDLAPPSDNAWLKRIDDHVAVIGCYMSRQTWQVKCVNGVWTGTVGVCIQTEFDEIG